VTDAVRIGIEPTIERVRQLCARAIPGSVQIQLRDREIPARIRLELGRRLIELTRAAGQVLAVNDRADIAAMLGADALHLGELGIDAREARMLLGDDVWISRAWHPGKDPAPPEDLERLDAVVIAPVLAPRTGRPELGTDGIARARHSVSAGVRVYALGGVDASNASACLRAGADGIAAIGAVFDTDPLPLLAALGIG
jgi:thiamine-phosphate pyrophosphorylase